MAVALITGITGQDGSYLTDLLLDKGYTVHGMVRPTSTESTWRLEPLPRKGLTLHDGDLCDAGRLTRLLADIAPDEVYNLAAQSHVGTSFATPLFTAEVTGLGALRLLEAARAMRNPPRIYQASSSEVFGNATESPQHEGTPLRPCSPYGASKAFAHHMVQTYRDAYGLHASNGILFNHESPRRGVDFVTRKITVAVGRIAAGLQDTLVLGNLDARRDWGFAGDYVEAMWRMLQQPQGEDYVVATGETHSVRDFCHAAFEHVGLDWRNHVEVDTGLYRPTEVHEVCGNATRAQEQLQWRPKVGFAQLVRMMVDADVQRALQQKRAIDPRGATTQ